MKHSLDPERDIDSGQRRKDAAIQARIELLRRKSEKRKAQAQAARLNREKALVANCFRNKLQLALASRRRARHLLRIKERARILRFYISGMLLQKPKLEQTHLCRIVRRIRAKRALANVKRLNTLKHVLTMSFPRALSFVTSPESQPLKDLVSCLLPGNTAPFLYGILLLAEFRHCGRSLEHPGFNVNLPKSDNSMLVHLPILLFHSAFRLVVALDSLSDLDENSLERLKLAKYWRRYYSLFYKFKSNHLEGLQSLGHQAVDIAKAHCEISDSRDLKEIEGYITRILRAVDKIQGQEPPPWAVWDFELQFEPPAQRSHSLSPILIPPGVLTWKWRKLLFEKFSKRSTTPHMATGAVDRRPDEFAFHAAELAELQPARRHLESPSGRLKQLKNIIDGFFTLYREQGRPLPEDGYRLLYTCNESSHESFALLTGLLNSMSPCEGSIENICFEMESRLLTAWANHCKPRTVGEYIKFENSFQFIDTSCLRKSLGTDFAHLRFAAFYRLIYESDSAFMDYFEPSLICRGANEVLAYGEKHSQALDFVKRVFAGCLTNLSLTNKDVKLLSLFEKGWESLCRKVRRLLVSMWISTTVSIPFKTVYAFDAPDIESLCAACLALDLSEFQKSHLTHLASQSTHKVLGVLREKMRQSLLGRCTMFCVPEFDELCASFYNVYHPIVNWIWVDFLGMANA